MVQQKEITVITKDCAHMKNCFLETELITKNGDIESLQAKVFEYNKFNKKNGIGYFRYENKKINCQIKNHKDLTKFLDDFLIVLNHEKEELNKNKNS